MYKDIKLLKRSENLENKFSKVSIEDKLENNRLFPLGVDEVIKYCSSFPIVISGKENPEFVFFIGLSKEKNPLILNKNLEEPRFLQNYPFLMVDAKNEEDNYVEVLAYDDNKKYVNQNEDIPFFIDDKTISNQMQEKINSLRELQQKRKISKIIIKELQDKDLLIKQSFNVKIDGKIINILKEYYIINRPKLSQIDDATLALWAKKGWMGIIDAHTYSLRNFKTLVDIIK